MSEIPQDIITELKRVAYVMFKDGWQSKSVASRAELEIIDLRAKVKRLETALAEKEGMR